MRELLTIMLRKEGYEVTAVGGRAAAASQLARSPAELIITDVKLPDGDGIEILRHVKAKAPDTIVIVMTAFGSTEMAVAAMKLGAHDYLTKPFDVEELKIVVRNALQVQQLQEENQLLRSEFQSQHGLESITGSSPPMLEVFKMVRSIAPTGSTVLITGDSGTGKELIAKAVHALSPRSVSPFISINCGALPEGLLESELFGHVKGAFTDAHQNKKGLFEAAHRGTLFLDEVGDTPRAMQVKLLRALQERTIRRVGGTEEIEVDVRVIAATNQPLEPKVKALLFREDLFYRLNVIPIRLPSLRERREDIPLLAQQFLTRFAREIGKQIAQISPEAMKALTSYAWPGNVRELENVIERAVALETSPTIRAERLPESLLRRADDDEALPELASGFRLDDYMKSVEQSLLRKALAESGGDRSQACRLLGVSPRSLRYLVQKYPDAIAQRE